MRWYTCKKTCPYLLFLLALLISSSTFSYAASGIIPVTQSDMECIGKEREALLEFKQGIQVDPCGLLTSWTGQDCCRWHGISCSNHSGHVIGLDLHPDSFCALEGKVSPSLVELKYLEYLDLSNNNFQTQPIPSFIGSLHSLKYLHLSDAQFGGQIPHQLANLSSLISLDLSGNYDCYSKSLGWLSHLTLLGDVNLSSINLTQAADWMQVVNNLPFLRSLKLDNCSLPPSIPSSLSYKNSSTTLRILSLVENALNDSPVLQWLSNLTVISIGRLEHLSLSSSGLLGSIPSGLGNMHSLSYLDLSGNHLEGQIPGSIFELKLLEFLDLRKNNFQGIEFSNSLGNLCSLQTLDLGENNITNDFSSILQTFSGCANKSLVSLDVTLNRLWGSIPDMIGTFSSLEKLSLGYNQLNGTVSPSLGQLSRLELLDFSSNSLRGTLSNHHLSNLSRLSELALYNNPELAVNFSDSWVPPFQLDLIFLSSCKLGPYFPKWLLTQRNFTVLFMSDTGIYDTIPASFWKSLPSNLWQLNMSHNGFYGVLPNLSISFHVILDLSSNRIEGAIPSFLGDATVLLLNDNKFSGSVAPLCPKTKGVLQVVDLSNNFLSGKLPDCWGDLEETLILRLDNNNFTGKIPPSMGALNQLGLLTMRNNGFNGELQNLFGNWTSLTVLDLGYNSFSGYIPAHIGNTLKSIEVLNLQRNNLSGGLPLSLCQLTNLQIVDISFNHISGTIPTCICNLLAMAKSANNMTLTRGSGMLFNDMINYAITEMIMWKRKEQSFSSNLGLVRYISISDNELEGQIPRGISCLKGLISLDLARNNLTGTIPTKIGEVTSLEFLDLSGNHLSGHIPSSLANLNFLGMLNLSCNNLSGRIPTGTQLQRLDQEAYMGNPGLCGSPLPECTGDPGSHNKLMGDNVTREEENDDGSDIYLGFYISVVLGFVVGFWGVCGTLVIKMPWRQAFFQFVEDMYDRLHMMVAVTIARVWRRP